MVCLAVLWVVRCWPGCLDALGADSLLPSFPRKRESILPLPPDDHEDQNQNGFPLARE
jgi:hypothetical protein